MVKWQSMLLLGVGLSIIIAVALVDAVAQDPLYHLFADQRPMFGIPNFMNVMSNLPFLIVGILGWRIIASNAETVTPTTRLAWIIFFFGIALTAFGSGYFHLEPNNDSLLWDRIPMTIGFMSLVSVIISEYFSPQLGKKLLLPLLFAGISSVVYWAHTESLGAGDLRAYAIVQFLPMLLIPLTIVLYKTRSDLGRYIWLMIGFYVAAKLAEQLDDHLYAVGNAMSGHTLKHLLASMAPASLLYGLLQRRGRGA
jgi:ceramidase